MAMVLGEVYQARFVAQFGNQVSINVRHYVVTNVTGAGRTAQQMAAYLDGVFAPLYKLCISAIAIWRGTGLKRLQPTPEIEYSSTANAGVGALAGDPLPPQTAGLVGLQTTVPGPSGHGRVYMPFPTESVNDANGLCTAAYQILILAVGNQLAQTQTQTVGADSVTVWPIILHRDTGFNDKLILGGTYVRNRWATQRRRSGFGAANQLPF